MADLSYIQRDGEVQIVGQDNVGNQVNYVTADVNGNLAVKDYADGPVTPGAVAALSTLIGGQYNTTLPTLTNTQQSAIQIDASGRLIIAPTTQGILAEDHNYGTVGANTLRTASQIGNATGGADFAAGNSSAQTLRVVIASNQLAIPVTQSTSPWIVKDLADGSAAGGTAGTFSQLAGGIYNPTPPTLTTGQQASLQLALNGSLLVQITNSTPLGVSQSADWVVVGTLTNNNASPAATNVGALVAIAESTISASRYTSGDQVLLVTDLAGNTNVDLQYVAGTAAVTAGVAGLLAIGGNVASGSADDGNGVKTSAVAVANIAGLPTVTTGQRVDNQADLNGRLYTNAIPQDGAKATYSAAVSGLASAASATDVFTITGSATRTIRITHIRISGVTTSTGVNNFLLIKRSAANTGGTTTGSPAAVPHDSGSAAASATILAYTANPSALGAAVGTIRSANMLMTTATPSNAQTSGVQIPIEWYFGTLGQAPVLRGTAQVLAINLNGVTISGSSLDMYIEWTEE